MLDNLSTGNLRNIVHNKDNENFQHIEGDIRDGELVKKIMTDVDAVFHEAALVKVTLSVQDPLLANDINVSGALNLLKAASDAGVKRFILASSAAVYGDSPSPRKVEDMQTNPSSPYGVTKLAAEKYLNVFQKVYGLETVSLRYFNVYGPRQNCDLQAQYGGVVNIFLNRLVRNLSPIVYGDGEQTRDFVFVEDIVRANMCALNSKNAIGNAINIGSGTRISVNQIAETLKRLLNKTDIKNTYKGPQAGDIRHTFADISKAVSMLGFTPNYSLAEGLQKLIVWFVNNQTVYMESETNRVVN
jgi:nucleoside-diphosphate-sugar epimerase